MNGFVLLFLLSIDVVSHLFYSTLTFLYLPVHNFWMLLCPNALSYDWQMGSLPLVQNPWDPRACIALPTFYGSLLLLGFTTLVHRSTSVVAVSSNFVIVADNVIFALFFHERVHFFLLLSSKHTIKAMEKILSSYFVIPFYEPCTALQSCETRNGQPIFAVWVKRAHDAHCAL
jgi:hypothetical protein